MELGVHALVKRVKKLAADESGATAVEYGLITALIAIAIISSLQLLGPALDGIYLIILAAL